MGGGVFSHDLQNQGKFGLALVCEDIDPMVIKPKSSEEELENIYVTFLSMGFLKSTLIASGDDGFVSYLELRAILIIGAYSCIYGNMRES